MKQMERLVSGLVCIALLGALLPPLRASGAPQADPTVEIQPGALPITAGHGAEPPTFVFRSDEGQGQSRAEWVGVSNQAASGGPDLSNGVEHWYYTSPLLDSRTHHGMVAVNGYLFVVGGDDGDGTVYGSVLRAQITAEGALGPWEVVSSLTTPRTRAAVVAAGDRIYVIGGYDGTGALSTVEWTTVQSDGTLAPWTTTSSLHTARAGAAAIVVRDRIYVLGGETADGEITDSVEMATINADGALGPWTSVSPLRTPRRDAAAVYAPGIEYVYLLGGSSSLSPLNSVEKAPVNPDGSLGPWAPTTGLLFARQELAATFYMGYLFAFGGQTVDGYTIGGVEFAPIFLDGTGDVGDWLPTASLNEDRAGLAIAVASGQVYATGGHSDRGTRSTAERAVIRGSVVIPPPRLYDVLPPGGPNDKVTTITLYGHSFVERPSVQIGGTLLENVAFIDATTLTATVPSGLAPGVYDVIIANPDGQTAVLEAAYTVVEGNGGEGPAPTLTAISPTSAENSADVSLVLTGTNFVSTTTVLLGDIALRSVVFLSSSRLEAIVPQGTPPGVYDVRVVNPDGQMAQLSEVFTVSAGNGVWRLKRGRMTPRYGGGAGVIGGLLYAVGGRDPLDFGRLNEAYDPSADQWGNRMDLPGTGGRLLPGVVVLDGRLYIFGGRSLAHGTTTSEAYVYDPGSGIWTRLADYPVPAYGLAVAADGSLVYLFGGEQPPPTGNGPGSQYSNVYAYDPATDTYIQGSDLPVAVSRAVALAYGGKIYVIGGLRAGAAYDGVQVYDPVGDTWSTAAPLPQPRAEAVGVVWNGRLYVIGGHDGAQVHRTVYEYDPATDTWQERTPLTTPRSGAFGGLIDGKIYVAGGRSSLQVALPLDSVEEGDLGEAPPQPRLYLSEIAHDFGEIETGWQFEIANVGSGTLTWSITKNPAVDWLQVEPASGSGASTVRVSVFRDGLAAGRYATDLNVISNGGQATVHIEMQVVESPLLQVTPTSLVFNVGEDSHILHVVNLGGGNLEWSISVDQTWVHVDRESGTGNADVTVTVDRSGLPSGESTIWLRVTSNGGDAEILVRVYKEPPPALEVRPSSLDFGTDRTVMPFEIINAGGGVLAWHASADQPWLTLSRTDGENDSTVQVSVQREGLAPGEHTATITVSGAGQQRQIAVRLVVQATPRLSVSTSLIDLGSTSKQATFEIHNDGDGVLQWDVYENVDWLWVEPAHGENDATVTVYVDRTNLSPGEWSTTLQIDSPYGTAAVEVRMTVEQGPLLRVAPMSIDLGTQSTSGEFQIQNAGGGTLTWSISNIPNWLRLSRTNGTGDAWVQVTALRDQMAPGSYTAQLLVQGDGTAGEQTVTVYAVQEAAPQLEVSPTRLDFGDSTSRLYLTVRNAGGGTLTWQATDNRDWITLSHTSGTNDGTIEVRVDRGGQAPGQYTGQVTIQGGGRTVRVDVIMDVQPPEIDHLTVGNVTVYADNFEWQGGQRYKATGNVRFNSHARLRSTGDYCIVDLDNHTIYGKGTVALITTRGTVDIFRDEFSVSTNDGRIHPRITALFNLLFDEIATFDVVSTIEVYVDVVRGRATGEVRIRIEMPDNHLQETLNWTLDRESGLSGSIRDLSLQVDGLTLRAQQISVSEEGLRVRQAYLEFPASLGGSASAVVRDLIIKGEAPYLELDGVFEINDISFGGPTGFEIQHARLELRYVGGEFRLAGSGKFVFKNFYQYGQCLLDIEFEIYSLDRWSGAFEIHCSNGVPIGTTGFFITGVHGSVSFGQYNFEISLGVTIVGGPFVPHINEHVISGRSTLFFRTRSGQLALGLEGDVRILKWDVAHAELEFRRQGDWAGVHGEIQIDLSVVQGEASVDIWQDRTGAHFRGDGNVEVVIPECFIIDRWLLCIPPSDWPLFGIRASVGEFTQASIDQKVYGLKATFDILGYEGCMFVDAQGNLRKCNEVLGMTTLIAGRRAVESSVVGLVEASVDRTYVEITRTHPILFALGWDTGSPRLRLIDPDGRVIDEDTTASDVQTMRTVTQTLIGVREPVTGTWTVEVYNLAGNENYDLVLFRGNVPPSVVVQAPSAPAEEGTLGYRIQWEAIDPDDADATVNLYYGPSLDGPWYPIASQMPLTMTDYLWDTRGVPTGEYFIRVEADDGANLPQGAISAGTVRVENRDAPPAPAITSIIVDSGVRSCTVRWSPVDAPDLEGYRVYYGYTSGEYEGFVDVGSVASAEILTLEPERPFYIAVTAYDSSGNESAFSNEVTGELKEWQVFLPLILRNHP